MNRKTSGLITIVGVCLLLSILGSIRAVSSTPLYLNQGQNTTYLPYGGAIKLYAQGKPVNSFETHDFTDTTDNKAWENRTADTPPPSVLDVSGQAEASSGDYTALSASDDSRWDSYTIEANFYMTQRYNFTVDGDVTEFTKLKIAWEGYGGRTTAALYNMTLWIWNVSQWSYLGEHTSSTDAWINATLTTSLTNYIDASNRVAILAMTGVHSGSADEAHIYTDYVAIELTPKTIDYAILSTNETGAWENKTTYGSPKDMGDASSATWSNFTWQNTSLDCNKIIGWRIYYNDSAGEENVTSINTFYYIPYVNSTSYALSKITSATCESKHNITLTFAATPEGRVSVIMPFVYFGSTAECAYEGSEGTRITIYNESEYCWIRLNHSSLSAGDTIKIYSTKSLRVEPPPNLPAALTAAAVGLIIVIYFIVSKEEE